MALAFAGASWRETVRGDAREILELEEQASTVGLNLISNAKIILPGKKC
jgi:hypothetical protein